MVYVPLRNVSDLSGHLLQASPFPFGSPGGIESSGEEMRSARAALTVDS